MSFTDITLPASVMGDIYKNNLVEIDDNRNKIQQKSNEGRQEIQPVALLYLGKNLKDILVFVNYPEEVFLPQGQLEFLGKILAACNLNIGDIAIVNMANQQTDHNSFIKALNPKSVIIFGAYNQAIMGNQELAFFSPAVIGEISVINAPALEKLSQQDNEGKQLKSLFWNCLKQFFNL